MAHRHWLPLLRHCWQWPLLLTALHGSALARNESHVPAAPTLAGDGVTAAAMSPAPPLALAVAGAALHLLIDGATSLMDEEGSVVCGSELVKSCEECSVCDGDCIESNGECVRAVSCGGHKAGSCEECSGGIGKAWCNGECTWRHERCVPKVSCGGHLAGSCGDCPQGRGKAWCNGDCVWWGGRCTSALDPFVQSVWFTMRAGRHFFTSFL
mmetsp:Transcript_40910/g.117522  ORF Transcript_40910/g.117522 Transcript_40910/m.117522 type:complete len:211 (+) Transcript_40910:99-731(+)